MLGKLNVLQEIGRRGEDVSRATIGIDLQQEFNEAGDYRRVAGRRIVQSIAAPLGHYPHLGLAAMQLVLVDLPRVGKRWRLTAQIDDVLVAVRPIFKDLEGVDDIGLRSQDLRSRGETRASSIARSRSSLAARRGYEA